MLFKLQLVTGNRYPIYTDFEEPSERTREICLRKASPRLQEERKSVVDQYSNGLLFPQLPHH